MPITGTQADITNTNRVGSRPKIWLWANLVDFDQGQIVSGWLPAAPYWLDVTDEVMLEAGITNAHDGISYKLSFTVYDLDRAKWYDTTPVAYTQQFYTEPAGWGDVTLRSWGYITGVTTQSAEPGMRKTATVAVDYLSRWSKLQVPAHKFGRENIAAGASVTAGPLILSTPQSEAPLEFISQKDVGPSNVTDGNIDTVSIIDAFPTALADTFGDTTVPRILRMYSGRNVDTIGVGNEPVWIELYCSYNITPWGTTWSGIPDMYNTGSGEGQPAIRTDSKLSTQVVTYPDGSKGFQVTSFQNSNVKADTWVQWIVQDSRFANYPMKVSFDIKAGSAASIGKGLYIYVSDAQSVGASTQTISNAALGADLQHFEFPFDSSTAYAGAKINIKTEPGATVSSNVIYEIKNLRVAFGYDNDLWQEAHDQNRLWIVNDNGLGNERWTKVAFELEKGGNWRIPADDTIIICDDAGIFNAKFPTNNKTVYEMKTANRHFLFAPSSAARLKLVMANNPIDVNDYDGGYNYGWTGEPGFVIEEHIFNTYVWQPTTEAVKRLHPLGTGNIGTEASPRPGLDAANPSVGWFIVDLGEYAGSLLVQDIGGSGSSTSIIEVNDVDEYDWSGYVKVNNEIIQYSGKTETGLIIAGRGINGSGVAAHTSDGFTTVIQLRDGNIGTGFNVQTGHLIDYIQFRRKDGKPAILQGRVIYSNLPAPSDPSTGGQRWERNPDWTLLSNFNNDAGLSTIEVIPAPYAGGAVQARHICLVVDKMQNGPSGKPSRVKLNEVVVRKRMPGSTQLGQFYGHSQGDVASVVGHLLTRHGDLPLNKFNMNTATLPAMPISDLTVSPTALMEAVNGVLGPAQMVVWFDEYNYAILEAQPNSFRFSYRDFMWQWTEDDVRGTISASWDEPNKVSQVVATGRDATTFRMFQTKYPSRPRSLGDVVNLTDIMIRSLEELKSVAHSAYRADNARLSVPVSAGAAPWVKPFQRHIVTFKRIDVSGVNFYVASFTESVAKGEGSPQVTTSIQLKEMPI